LYEETTDLCRTINTEGIILDCNKSYADGLGYSKKEIIGRSIFEHTAKDSFAEMRKSFNEWIKTGRVDNIQVKLKRKDGSTFPVKISAASLFDENGKLIGSSTVIKDISEIDTLKKIEKQKDEFFGMVSHELRTPLYQISGYSELLMAKGIGPLTKKQREAIKIIYEGSSKLDKLISGVFEAQKLEIDAVKMARKPIDVKNLLFSTHRNHAQLMKEKEIEFVNSFAPEKLIIKSDEDKLAEVFTNLIQNAVDFVPKKTGKIEIGAFQRDQNDQVVFYVKDNGIGIPQCKQKNLFKKFYKIDTSLKRKHGGSGLGLSICKGIVEKLGGKIWVESKSESGSIFCFSITKDRKKTSFEDYEKDYVARFMMKKEKQKVEVKLEKKKIENIP